MAANGTPQSYLNSLRPQSNSQVNNIRDRSMEQDNTNSGNPYGYMPQLPGQQIPSQYPTNRYIPPEWNNDGSTYGSWSNQGLTYSLPTAYTPYGQGGMPYGPTPRGGMFGGNYSQFGGDLSQAAAGGVGSSGPIGATLPGNNGMQVPPMSPNVQRDLASLQHALGMYSGGAAAAGPQTNKNRPLPQQPVKPNISPPPAAPPVTTGGHRQFGAQPPGDFWKGIVPHFTSGNTANQPAVDPNQLAGQMQYLAAQQMPPTSGKIQPIGASGAGNMANSGVQSINGAYTGGFGTVGQLGSFGSYMPAISYMGQTPNGY